MLRAVLWRPGKNSGVRFIKRRFINCVSTKHMQIVADLGKAVFTVADSEA